MESGASIRTLMPRQVTSELGEEFIALEILPKTGQGVEHFSHQPGHVDFGELGDEQLQGKVAVVLRSMGVAYDIPVEVSVEGLADANGKAPKEPWLLPDRKTILLKPGRAEQLVLVLKIPDRIEDEIADGLFKGQLVFMRKDLGEPMTVKRFRPISGVADDEPTDLLTFTLRRPSLEVRAPRCLRNALVSAKDGRRLLPVNVTIAKPFDRNVTLVVRHSSVITRPITLLPEGSFVDTEGRQVPYVRLLPEDSDALTRDIATGASATWRLRFEADELYGLRKAIGKIVVSGPGLPTMHITVEIRGRDPLLGPVCQRILWLIGFLLLALALYALVRYWQARRFREDREITVTEQRALAGYVSLKTTGKDQVTLLTQQPIYYQMGAEPKKRLAENRPLTLKGDAISADRPLVIAQQTAEGEEGWSLAFHEFLLDPPEVRGTIQSAPVQAQQAALRWRQMHRRFLSAAAILSIAAMFFTPWVVRTAQWLYDFIP